MTWTWRRTLLAIGMGFAMLATAFVLGLQQASAVSELKSAGHAVPALVTAAHDGRFSDWNEVRYRANGHEHTVRIVSDWATTKDTGERLTVYVDPTDPRRVTTADGHTSLGTAGWLAQLTLLGMVAVFVGASGRFTTVRRRRWKDVKASQLKVNVAVDQGTGRVYRVDVAGRAMFVVAACLATLAFLPGINPLSAIAVTPFLALFGFQGWGYWVRVTPAVLSVATFLRITHVSRANVAEVRPHRDDTDVLIRLRNGADIRVPTGMSLVWTHEAALEDMRPSQLKAVARIHALLNAIPAEAGAQTVTVERRFVPAFLLIASLIAAVASIAAVVSGT